MGVSPKKSTAIQNLSDPPTCRQIFSIYDKLIDGASVRLAPQDASRTSCRTKNRPNSPGHPTRVCARWSLANHVPFERQMQPAQALRRRLLIFPVGRDRLEQHVDELFAGQAVGLRGVIAGDAMTKRRFG